MGVKVLHLGQAIGGLDIYIRNTCKYLPNDIQFVIVRGEADNSRYFVNIDNEVITEYKIPLYREINIINDIRSIIKAIRIVKKEKPDIIHVHSAKGGLVGRLVGAFTNTKTFYTPHAFSFLSASSKLVRYIYRLIEKVTRFNSFVLACSESEKALAINEVNYKIHKVLVWSNSVPDAQSLIRKRSFKPEVDYVATIGRPSYQKNTIFLIDIVRKVVERLPEFKIYILGVGHHSPELEVVIKKIDEFDLHNNVVLTPWVKQEDALSYVSSSMFYISVARYEGLPLAILEAMSLGKAIIASNAPGNNDCVIHKKNGFILPFDDALFAEKVIELWTNMKKRQIFEDNSKIIFDKEFNIEQRISDLYSIYMGKY